VNAAETEAEINAIRTCVLRGLPFGDSLWVKNSAVRLGLESTTRPRGRPRKESRPLFPFFGLQKQSCGTAGPGTVHARGLGL